MSRTYWTASELLAHEFPPPRWAVPGLVPEGLTLLVGSPKVGKSWAALALAIAVANGGRAFGQVPVDAGQVAYLALEDSPRRLQDRLGHLLAGDEPGAIDLFTEWPAIGQGGIEQLDRWCADHPDRRLIIVDVLQRLRGHSGTESAYSNDYNAICGLKQIADRYGVAILVLHHDRKAQSDDFLDAVSGTHGLAGAADGLLYLHRQRGAADAVLKVTGRDIEDAEHALAFDLDAGGWRLLKGIAADYQLGDTRRRILQHVREVGPGTPKALALALGIDYELVKKTARRMADAGQLDTDGQGTYRMPVGVSLMSPLSPAAQGHEGREGQVHTLVPVP